MYIQDPDSQQYATYVAGASTNGGSRYIASQQSYWVHCFAASPVLMATEGVKADVDQQFIKSTTYSPGMTVRLSGTSEFDELVVRHIDGTNDAFDYEFDAVKYWGGWGDYPQFSALNGSNEDLTVHSFDKGDQEWEIPLRAVVFQDGFYDIEFSQTAELDVPCMKLEDTYDGTMYDVYEGASYTFAMDDSTYAPRFILHIGKNYEIVANKASCFGAENGSVEIYLDEPNATDYELVFGGNSTFGNNTADPLVITGLDAGTYNVIVPSISNLCDQTDFEFVVYEPAPISAAATIQEEQFGNDGMISLNVSGGTSPYSFVWDNGGTAHVISGLSPGAYTVEIMDANGCMQIEQYSVQSVLGIDDEEIEVIFVYNRLDQQITISGLMVDQPTQLFLYSVSGTMICSYEVYPGVDQHQLNVPAYLSEGIYVLGGQGMSFKFSK